MFLATIQPFSIFASAAMRATRVWDRRRGQVFPVAAVDLREHDAD